MEHSMLAQLTDSERERLLKVAEARSIRKPIKFAPIPITEGRENLPLSFAQQRLWFLAQMEGGSKASHMPLGVRLRGRLDREALKQALDRIVARHEALRTTFVMVEGEPLQQIAPVDQSCFHLLEHDVREHGDAQGELERLMAEEARAEFDLQAGPLIRGRLIRVAEEEHWLLITMQHIVSDGWSMGMLFKELSVLYGAYVRGEQDPLPELAVQYADYAVWQRKWMEGEVLQQQAEYWRENLEGMPELLELPADRVRPARQDYAGAVVELVLKEKLTAGLKELSVRHGTTLYMTLLAGWAVLLGRLSGQQDVVIGTPVANRGRVEIESLIGFFVNTLVLRVDVSGRPTVGEVLERVKRQAIEAQQHQDIPFEQVVELVQPVRSLAHSPLFQVMFAWQDVAEGTSELPGLEVGPLQFLPNLASEFDLTVSLQESGGCIEGGVEYATALFEAKTVERYVGYFTRLLEGMVAGGESKAVDDIAILGKEERRQVVYDWNRTQAEIPSGCVQELFEEQVQRTPEAVALEWAEGLLSYAELNARANRLAHYLRRCGVSTETRVGVCLERSAEMVVAMLGILKAGGAYVPLDAEYPAERLVFMIEDAGVGLVLTERRMREHLPVEATQFVPLVCVDGDGEAIAEESSENVGVEVDGRQLAYVMYTSGSTGRPKGVMVTHRNVVRLVRETNYVEFGPGLVIGHVSNVVFDASTFEIWGALLNGGRLAVIPKFDVLTPEVFRRQLKELGVSTLFLTTALFQECVRSSPGIFGGMDQVLFGGELCDAECVRRGVEEEGPRELVHVYGPTETTTYASYFPVKGVEKRKAVPVGRPIGNTQLYVVDGEMEAVGVGVAGEICVGGLGVARGYGNCAEMTAERFVPNPYAGVAGARMYRTGDLGRWHSDGAIEFLGRRDEQVKIRGYRIELGEVEAALREQAGVKEAVVIAWLKENGDKQLVGYVVGEKGAVPSGVEVREGVRKKLPEYMVPMVVVLEELPLTGNGKVDRGKLPRPEEVLEERGGQYVGPRNRTEAILAEVWAEGLGLERVGVEENFFELGGDSILCVRIIGLARDRGLEFSVQDLFEHQTIAALAGVVRGDEGEERIVTAPFELVGEEVRSRLPEDVEDAYPLSRLQAGMLFHSGYAPGSGMFHVVIGWRVHLPYQTEKFQSAVGRLTQRHEMLRTSIDMASFREPLQLVHRRVDLKVVEQDWRGRSVAEQGLELTDFAERQCKEGFAWEQAPLLRIFVHRLSECEFQCSFNFHHAIMDGWSDASLITELVQDYQRRLAGGSLEVKPIGVTYRDYIALERRAMASQESITFWKRMLEGHTPTPVPLRDWCEEEGPASSGEMVVQAIAMSEETQNQLQQLAREIGTPLKTVLLAAHMKALQVLTGQSDVTTGVVLNGRPEVEGGEQVVGLFLNAVPFRLRLECGNGRTLIRETFAAEQRILPHRRYPMLDLRGQMGGDALFETAFNFVHFHVFNELGDQGGSLLEGGGGYARANLDFFVHFGVSPDTGKLWGVAQSDTGMMSAAVLEHIASYYARILAGMIEDRIGDVRSEEERAQLEEWNRTEAEIPRGCVHELFEEQVERTPEAVALAYEGQQLTYGELNRRSNQLGHYLRSLGVGPEARVGICVERGLELIVGLLAVLKAGGVYVALDPKYPEDRLRYMAADAKACLIITTGARKDRASDGSGRTLLLDDERPRREIEQQPEENLGKMVTAESLAYVMYTSGSTGRPKGAMIHQGGMLNHLRAKVLSLDLTGSDVVAQNAPSSFDISVWQSLAALLVGGRVQVIPDDTALDAAALLWAVQQGGVTVLETVPTLLAMMIAGSTEGKAGKPGLSRLRWLISNAEALPVSLCRQWFEAWPEVPLVNTYGATECSDDISHQEQKCIPEQKSRAMPLGRPLMNLHAYVLDGLGMPAPVGVRGEIFIGGEGVGRGYWNGAALTAERFVPDPYSGRVGGRMYRTGDLGQWSRNQNLEFVGRTDHQVKIRGHRIELGEIEARLAEHDGVKEAVVVLREDAAGEKRLVAYYTCREGSEAGAGRQEGRKGRIGAEELREHVGTRLPEYMVPAAYVWLEKLPLTPSGKVDRKGLPEPEGNAYAVRSYEAPEGEVERLLAEIWVGLLKVEQVGRQDNFFELGGHSLVATQLVARVDQTIGVRIGIREVFEFPELSSLATQIRHAQFAEFDSEEFVQMMRDS
jgi:amino acid adenylation domain-containing protein